MVHNQVMQTGDRIIPLGIVLTLLLLFECFRMLRSFSISLPFSMQWSIRGFPTVFVVISVFAAKNRFEVRQ